MPAGGGSRFQDPSGCRALRVLKLMLAGINPLVAVATSADGPKVCQSWCWPSGGQDQGFGVLGVFASLLAC